MYNEYVVVNAGSLKRNAHMVISLGVYGMIPSSPTPLLENMVGKANEGICFCGGDC